MKKIIVLVLIFSMVFMLVGCSSKNSDPNEVAKRYFYSLLDGDNEAFLSCINEAVLESKLAQHEVTKEEFEEYLKEQLTKISVVFKQKGFEKEDFYFENVEYKSETTVIVKVKLNNHEMPIPLYKSNKDNWYIVDKFIDGLLKTMVNKPSKDATNL